MVEIVGKDTSWGYRESSRALYAKVGKLGFKSSNEKDHFTFSFKNGDI